MHAAGTDDLELKITPEAPMDFFLVLGQNLQGARAHRPQTNYPQAQRTLLADGFGKANSR
jgi:hypothetical protein